jgi:hypothetical protein
LIASRSSLTDIYIILLSERIYVALAINWRGLENLTVTFPFMLIVDIIASNCFVTYLGKTTGFLTSEIVILIAAVLGFELTTTYIVY